MDIETQLLREYESLRSEIRNADTLNYQIIGIVVGAVALLLSTGFKEANPSTRLSIFLCIYVVTIPALRLLQGNRRRTWRISTYLQVFVESRLELIKWECRLRKQGLQPADKGTRHFFSSLAGRNEWLIIGMTNSIAALASIFNGLLQINMELPYKYGGIAIIGILHLWHVLSTSHQEKTLRRGGKVEQGYFDSWIKIRDAEK